MRSSAIPSPGAASGSRPRSFSHPNQAIPSASAHETPNAAEATHAVDENAAHIASVNTIQPIGCAIHCE